jgi:hypothetical protein
LDVPPPPIWLEALKAAPAIVAAVAATGGAWLALKNWQLGEKNREIALLNAENAARWKQAELAASYMVPLFEDEELVFALRCIDWGRGNIPIPGRHLPMFDKGANEKTIDHNPGLLAQAMEPGLRPEISSSPQGMLYRLALDALFTRFEWIGHRVSNGLIEIKDVPDLEYWMRMLAHWQYAPAGQNQVFLVFLMAAGYWQTLKLIGEFGYLPVEVRVQLRNHLARQGNNIGADTVISTHPG